MSSSFDIQLKLGGTTYSVDLNTPIDISLSIADGRKKQGPSAWYVSPPRFEAVRGDGFVGKVSEGGSVNFTDVYFNPHGHGTHTECMGHITPEAHSVDRAIRNLIGNTTLIPCYVISVEPGENDGDSIITKDSIPSGVRLPKAVVIRTLPNSESKQTTRWDNSNPPYLDPDFTRELVNQGVEHLLIDLPSVDREVDGGVLASHRVFFGLEEGSEERGYATITEFVFVPNSAPDGMYALNLQVAPLDLDASPSRPVLFKLNNEG